MFDRDGSGAISKEELGTVMGSLGMCPSDEELRDMIREHDTDGTSKGHAFGCLFFFFSQFLPWKKQAIWGLKTDKFVTCLKS